MRGLTVRFTRTARAQLRSVGEYTEETWGKEQRDSDLGELCAGFADICKSPEKGRTRDELHEGLRSRRLQNYVAYYFVKKRQVVIVGILHERMDPSRHL